MDQHRSARTLVPADTAGSAFVQVMPPVPGMAAVQYQAPGRLSRGLHQGVPAAQMGTMTQASSPRAQASYVAAGPGQVQGGYPGSGGAASTPMPQKAAVVRMQSPSLTSAAALQAAHGIQLQANVRGRAVSASPAVVYAGRASQHQHAQQPVLISGMSRALDASTRFSRPSVNEGMRIIETISELLRDRNVLKRAVVQCFKRVDGGMDKINLTGLQQFRTVLSQVIQVPTEAFGDLVHTYTCFDFDGNGALEVNEVYKLVKFHLREYRKKLGFNDTTVDMPFRSIQEAGYNVTKELGRGSQGIVRLAVNSEGREVCVKCLQKAQMSASGIEELQEEFQTLQQLSCERIATVYELFQDAQFYYMVGEPYMGGDFMTLKQRARSQGVTMSEKWLRGIFRQCFDAIAFMHEQAMMHCDIKEPNIMLKTNNFFQPEVVLIDFGVSRAMAAKPNGMPGGTPGYMPPETLETHKWFPRGDIFSMGVVIMQVMTDKIPPTGARTVSTPGGIFVEGCLTIQDIMQATKTRQPPFHLMPAKVPGLTQLLKSLLQKKMQLRPTAPQALKDLWFIDSNMPAQPAPRAAGNWATVGITKSFLARPSVSGEDLPPAIAALRELHKVSSQTEEATAIQQLTASTQSAPSSIGYTTLSSGCSQAYPTSNGSGFSAVPNGAVFVK